MPDDKPGAAGTQSTSSYKPSKPDGPGIVSTEVQPSYQPGKPTDTFALWQEKALHQEAVVGGEEKAVRQEKVVSKQPAYEGGHSVSAMSPLTKAADRDRGDRD